MAVPGKVVSDFAAGLHCHYCGCTLYDFNSTWDHVIPRSQGGTNESGNLVRACKPCNFAKGSKTLDEYRQIIGGSAHRFYGEQLADCWAAGEDLPLEIVPRGVKRNFRCLSGDPRSNQRHSGKSKLKGELITMRTGLVKVLLNGRLCTGILGNKQPGPGATYSVIAFYPEPIRVESLTHRGKGAITGSGDYPSIIVGTLIPEAVVFEPGRITTHGVFFVDWDNDGAAEQMLEWYRYQEEQRQQTIAAGEAGVGGEQLITDSNVGN